MATVLSDLDSAPIADGLRVTLRMLEKLTRDGQPSTEDVRAVLDTGLARQQLEDALAICYALNVTNRVANAFGFDAMSPESFSGSGQVPARARLSIVVKSIDAHPSR